MSLCTRRHGLLVVWLRFWLRLASLSRRLAIAIGMLLAVGSPYKANKRNMSEETILEQIEPNREEQIHFRVTAGEKKAIVAKAQAAGYKKVSDYLRVVGLGAEIKEVVPADLRQQLVGIGTNLNQIARLAQAGKAFGSHEEQLVQALNIIRGYLI